MTTASPMQRLLAHGQMLRAEGGMAAACIAGSPLSSQGGCAVHSAGTARERGPFGACWDCGKVRPHDEPTSARCAGSLVPASFPTFPDGGVARGGNAAVREQ